MTGKRVCAASKQMTGAANDQMRHPGTGCNYTIRRARLQDIATLTSLLYLLFSVEEDFTFDKSRQEQGLALLLENERCRVLVAEIDSCVVGMCSGQLTISSAEGRVALLVEDVVVAKKWRGMGIGTALLDNIAFWATERGVNRMQLLADRCNAAALHFYKQLGWQQTRLICLRKYAV